MIELERRVLSQLLPGGSLKGQPLRPRDGPNAACEGSMAFAAKLVTASDPDASAAAAGLRYVNDGRLPGIRRQGRSRVRYVDADGRMVSDRKVLAWIKALAIPPAWTDVWICPNERGHVQATGRDARGRKQYRYHPRWREIRDEAKYGRLLEFAAALPKLRERAAADLRRAKLSREKVIATVVALLEKTLIRVGNEEYARANRSYGLTTMRDGHARVKGASLRFEFRGKSGIVHAIGVQDARLARIVKACRDLPGYELFQYVDDAGGRCGDRFRRRQRVRPRGLRRGVYRQGFPDVGRHRAGGPCPGRRPPAGVGRCRAPRRSYGRSSRRRCASATRWPCAASRTCIQRCSRPSSRATSSVRRPGVLTIRAVSRRTRPPWRN